ncbi:MAG: hypothetical protein ABI638_06730 [Ignavibacteriota bacterium]
MNEEEKINKKLLDDLKNLPKVEAPKNFETGLLRKINSSELEKKESFWDRILSPAKLAPAAVAAIIFFVVDIKPVEMEDPLNIAPRLREDIIVVESIKDSPMEQLKKSERVKEKPQGVNKGLIETKEIEKPTQRNKVLEEYVDKKSGAVEQSINDELVLDKSDADSFRSQETRGLGGSVAPAAINSEVSEISKDNLNFMQRNLSIEEKNEVQQLKMKVQSEKSDKTEKKSSK